MRSARVLEAVACDAFVASDPFTVAWLTGFAADETWGPNPFAAPPLAVVRSDASVVAIVSEDEAPALAGNGCEVVAYEGFTNGPLDVFGARAAALASLGLRGRVAVEDALRGGPRGRAGGGRRTRAAPPARRQGRRRDRAPARRDRHLRRRPGGGAERAPQRRRRARGLGRRPDRDGAGGGRAPLAPVRLRDRRAHGRDRGPSGLARGRRRRSRDRRSRAAPGRLLRRLLRHDRRRRRARRRALGARALPRRARARPRGAGAGLVAGDLDALVREGLDYPHHSGHGVGVSPHEEPRIVPGGETVLAPGMLVALEPGTYPGPWGMRVERVALITETGCEILSAHDLAL